MYRRSNTSQFPSLTLIPCVSANSAVYEAVGLCLDSYSASLVRLAGTRIL